MKKFNQTISVEVEVDAIADQLLSNFQKDYKHKEIVTEAIIGNAINSKGPAISQIYSALNGYDNTIDFAVGNLVHCTEKIYGYERVAEPVSDDDKPQLEEKYVEMGECEVKEIDLYRRDKLYVLYQKTDRNGNIREDTRWVNHKNCQKLQIKA